MDVVGVFRESFEVSKKNYVVFAPAVAAMVLMFVLTLLLAGAAAGVGYAGRANGTMPTMGAMAGSAMLLGIIGMVVSLFAHGMMVAMAKEAIDTGATSFNSGMETAKARFVPLLIGSILVGIIVMIGAMLLVIPGLIAGFLLMFTFVLIVVEKSEPFEAIKKSFALVKAHLGDSILFIVGAIVIGIVFGIVRAILGVIPFLGQLVGMLLLAVVEGYLSVALVRFYKDVKTQLQPVQGATP